VKLKGGLLPFPRTACALYAKRSYHIASELRPVPPRDLTRTVDKHVCQPGGVDCAGAVRKPKLLYCERFPALRIAVAVERILCADCAGISFSPRR
jgi:hypothetical protein